MRRTIRLLVSAAATAAAVIAASGGTAFAAVGAPSFTKGASGFNVYCAQMAMYEASQGTSATPDGDFGSQTLASVVAYQKSEGLQPDGEVGPLTGSKMWQMINWDIQDSYTGNFQTPWGVPISHCYQVLPTTS
ncbi:putative peptidoglycan binding protein [Streptomyces sp. 846.5]|nr:peptidoglycan-binding protein [Streptomyces sp. 846.5]TDT97541.1 putative peptidoglycan binding protein [Streptomyces sp. 846.5]